MKANFPTKETILSEGAVARKFPDFKVGDTVEISLFVREGDRERIQVFDGDVIAIHWNGIASTFIVRRICANNIGVEKIFPYYSPTIKSIKIIKRGKVRRAKLYYLRNLLGKAARVKEKILTGEEKETLKTTQAESEFNKEKK